MPRTNPPSSFLPPIDLVLNRFSNQQASTASSDPCIKQEPLWFDNCADPISLPPSLSNEEIKRKIEDMKLFKEMDVFDGVDSGFNSDINSVGSSNFLFPDVQCDGLGFFDKSNQADFSNQWMNFL